MNSIEDVIAAHEERVETANFEIFGQDFYVPVGVFCPFTAPSGGIGFALASRTGLVRGKRVLDVGCGCGVVASLLAMNGASEVVAIDICSVAVKAAKFNSRLAGVDNAVVVKQGDLYDGLSGDDKFDLIYADLPFCIENGRARPSERAFYAENASLYDRLLGGLYSRLNNDKAALYVTSSSISPPPIREIASRIEGESDIRLKIDRVMVHSYDWIEVYLDRIQVCADG